MYSWAIGFTYGNKLISFLLVKKIQCNTNVIPIKSFTECTFKEYNNNYSILYAFASF
jgi:hypothetical protein